MLWNWQLADWPDYKYDRGQLIEKEKAFLLQTGRSQAFFNSVEVEEKKRFIVEILSTEGIESARIEGEILDRKSLQASIKRHFGIQPEPGRRAPKEEGMAALLCDVYDTFDQPLTDEMLFRWHALLFHGDRSIVDLGTYRTHSEPMQIVSSRYDEAKVFFEAPPSDQVPGQMQRFIGWYNDTKSKDDILARAAIAHLYFESIHPFEDGNGRIGRALVEKLISFHFGRPVLIPVSKTSEQKKKDYYAALEKCNTSLDVQEWVEFFAGVILEAQSQALTLLIFLIEKTRLMKALAGSINERQEKALMRMFTEGVDGFKGGLSAEKYMTITKSSRATATRDLTDLVQKGALFKTGELRYTRYWLNLKSSSI